LIVPKTIILGAVALDNIKTPFGEVKDALGGSAAYASLAASFFSEAGIVAVVGKDFPQKHIDFLKKKKIDLNGLSVVEGKTFRWEGFYEYDMNQAHTKDTQLNVFSEFDPEVPEEYRKADFLYLGNITPDLQLKVLDQMDKRPKLVLSDTMDYWIKEDKGKVKEVIDRVDIALMNDGEARMLFDTPNLAQAGRKILELNSKYALIKKGEHGSLLFSENSIFAAPGYPLETVVDPTGAGDSFAGALIGYLAQQDSVSENVVRRGMIYASSIASFNAEGFSIQNLASITREDIEQRYEAYKKMITF